MNIYLVLERESKKQVIYWMPKCAFHTNNEADAWIRNEAEKRLVVNNKTYQFGIQNLEFFLRFFKVEAVEYLSGDLPSGKLIEKGTEEMSASEKLDKVTDELKEPIKEWKPQITTSYIGEMQPGYCLQPSDLELKIRKEVMVCVDKSIDLAFNGHSSDDIYEALEDIKLMLNLLWGE